MGIPLANVAKLAQKAEQLEKVGMLQRVQNFLAPSLGNAAVATGFGLMSGLDPVSAGLVGLVDLGVNATGTSLAGKYFPGKKGTKTMPGPDGKPVIAPHEEPSRVSTAVSYASPLVTTLLSMPLYERAAQQQQQLAEQQPNQNTVIEQQAEQRQGINGYPIQETSPGTQFQLQGMEHLLDRVDSYGLSRGAL